MRGRLVILSNRWPLSDLSPGDSTSEEALKWQITVGRTPAQKEGLKQPLLDRGGQDLFTPQRSCTESDKGKWLIPGASLQFPPYPCTQYATISLVFF